MSKTNRYSKQLILVLIFLAGWSLIVTQPLTAQDTTAKLGGVLLDSSRAVIPKATVEIFNLENGLNRVCTSNDAGNFQFFLLPPGHYRLTVLAPQFKKYTRDSLMLAVNQNLHLSITLQVGMPDESVKVTAEPPFVEMASVVIGKLSTHSDFQNLPLNGRNFSQLGILQAGAAPMTLGLAQAGGALRSGQSFSINGLRPESNNFLVDGARNINNVDAGFALNPPLDSIEEFRILTGGAPAEFGGNMASNTNLVTRSGGNQFHGTIYDYLRNDVFDARNFFASQVEPLKQNQFGANLGGPIKKNRTFFFGYYEGLRNHQGLTRTSTVPSLLEREGDFSQSYDANGNLPPLINYFLGSPYEGNRLPQEQINSISKTLLKLIPAPNIGTNLFNSTESGKNNSDQFGIRIDHSFSSRDDAYFRYSFAQGSSFNPFSINGAEVPGFPVGDKLRIQSLFGSDTHTFSPNLISFSRVAFFRHRFDFDHRFNQESPSSLGFNISPTFPSSVGPPFFQLSGGIASFGNPITGPRNTLQNSLELSHSFSWLHKSHSFKMGGEYRRTWVDAEQGIASNSFFVFAPFPISQPFANFLAGAPVVFFQSGGVWPRGLNNHDIALYIQDDYRPSRRLTLSWGFRYQINTPYTEDHNRLAAFWPGRQSLIFPDAPKGLLYPGDPGIPGGLVATYKKGFAPRLGLAWDPTGSGKSSLRASYGIYFEGLANGQGGILQSPISAPPYLQARQVTNIFPSAFGFPGPTFQDPFQGDPNPFPLDSFPLPITGLTIENNLRPPYVQNWDLSLQKELPGHYLLEARYVGTKGTRLPRFIEGNPPIYIPGQSTVNNIDQRRIYAGCKGDSGPCDFASVGLISGAANSTYHALQLIATRKVSSNYYFSASYTFSKSLDDVSSLNETGSGPTNLAGENDIPQNPFDWKAEHGPSIFDARHRFSMSGTWTLPYFKNSLRPIKLVLAGWELNGLASIQSGTPFTVYDGRDVAQQGRAPEISGFPASRPNLIGDPNLGPKTVERWFDTRAFQRLDPQLNAGQFGNSGRNNVRGPGFGTVDLSLLKNFSLNENQRIQFRFECFNVANHANFYLPENDIDSPNFGRILQAGSPRLLQFALKYMF
jgi:hypothetical protein